MCAKRSRKEIYASILVKSLGLGLSLALSKVPTLSEAKNEEAMSVAKMLIHDVGPGALGLQKLLKVLNDSGVGVSGRTTAILAFVSDLLLFAYQKNTDQAAEKYAAGLIWKIINIFLSRMGWADVFYISATITAWCTIGGVGAVAIWLTLPVFYSSGESV